MARRESLLVSFDDGECRLVLRAEMIARFAGMASSDLRLAQAELARAPEIDPRQATARDLTPLLEAHTRAVNALKALLALRDPDELVEAHMPNTRGPSR